MSTFDNNQSAPCDIKRLRFRPKQPIRGEERQALRLALLNGDALGSIPPSKKSRGRFCNHQSQRVLYETLMKISPSSPHSMFERGLDEILNNGDRDIVHLKELCKKIIIPLGETLFERMVGELERSTKPGDRDRAETMALGAVAVFQSCRRWPNASISVSGGTLKIWVRDQGLHFWNAQKRSHVMARAPDHSLAA